MSYLLAIMPVSIGGRLTTSSIIEGFIQNNHKVEIYDELKDKCFNIKKEYDYILGYDFSPVKFKIDNNLKTPCIAYFSDDINLKTAGVGFLEYKKYLKNNDFYVFYWDRELKQEEENNIKNLFYLPHFVNTKIYKDFSIPKNDVLFMGRLDTDLRLNTFIKLNKILADCSFEWYAIEKHYKDALSRLTNSNDKKIIQKTYKGFIDNEKSMAQVINNSKIIYNINTQGKTSLNYRTFQTLACKRLIISDKRKELDLFNNIIPTYDNIDDLAQKIKYYLKNSDEYKKIVETTYEIIIKNHSSEICAKRMFDCVKNL